MKKLFLLVMCILCSLGTYAQFSGKGSGTADDPYQITNADELFEVRNNLSASYKLMNDVDLTGWITENSPAQGWNPIGNESTPFIGSFNGNDKRIMGLFINRPTSDGVGLFGYIAFPCELKDVIIKCPEVKGNNYVGALAGYSHGGNGYNYNNYSSINTINVIMPKVKGANYIGGCIGYSWRTNLKGNSIVLPKIDGNDFVGGIAGASYDYNGNNYQIESIYIRNNLVAGGHIFGMTNVGGIIGYSGFNYSGLKYSNIMKVDIDGNSCSSYIKGTVHVGGICGRANSVNAKKLSTSSGYSNREDDWESCPHNFYNNLFSGSVMSEGPTSGIIGSLTCEIHKQKNTNIITSGLYLETYLNAYCNICSGSVYSKEKSTGIIGQFPSNVLVNDEESDFTITGIQKDALKQNVFCGDTLSAQNINSSLYRICELEGTNNYALTTAILLVDGEPFVIGEDNAQQGVSYGKKTLMKQTTYEGLDFDFDNNWAIVEGETYPYNINQCRPATITDFNIGASSVISGTAIGKSSQCNGSVYVMIDDNFYEGVVTNGQWSVQLGKVEEGQEAKVTVMVDGMMPSILVTAKAEKGTNKPIVDNTPDTDIAALDNAIYINNVEASAGTQLTLSVNMKNTVTAEGFGFDLYLPNGVTVATDEDGFPMVELSTERTTAKKTNSFDAAFQSDGSLRVLAASTNGSAISGNDGEVCRVTVNIANDIEPGDYAILLKNIAISDVNAVSHRTEQVKLTLTIDDYTPGDGNGDGVIDVSDFTATAHYLLGNVPTGFNVKAADANGDGVVDVADLTAVAHIILYGSVNRPNTAPAYILTTPQ